MELSQAEKKLLTSVQMARKSRRKMSPQAEAFGVDLEGAYRVQAASGEKRELKGYKLGVISPAKQAQMGINSPTYGRVYSEMLLKSPVHLSQFIQPRMEPELAVVLGADMPAHVSPERARQGVDGIFLGVDFLDSIWEGYRFSIADVVADNTSGGAFLLNEQRLHAPVTGQLRLSLNGELLTEGSVESLGDMGERLSWLSGEVGGLRAGDVIFLGSPAVAVPARPGALELHGPQESVLSTLIKE
jgi:2-oxo-3-hexenedioate decarboxylase